MKKHITICVIAVFFPAICVLGTIYRYPKEKRPIVDLRAACSIVDEMLRLEKSETKYYALRASLAGDKEQSGSGAWNMIYSSQKEGEVWAFIPFPEGTPSLQYVPTNGSNVKRREVKFSSSLIKEFTKQ